jgi:DNA gyrase subunit B
MQVLHSTAITKLKVVSCDLTEMYCLTVPEHHNFVLGCGVLSKNCHINSLLLTLFYKFLPELFNRGMVYVAEVPEFYAIDKAGKFYSAGKTEALARILDKAGVKADICHIKGYGEISAAVLRTLAFDPATRVLSRIVPTETASGEVEFTKLMGNDSEARKKLLGI